jgi:hypothetical protein
VNTLRVDGVDYSWRHRHDWFVWGKGVKAVSVSVSLVPGRTRELIVDLSFKVVSPERNPTDAKLARAVAAAIRSALEAGWKPESRGRAFRHEVTEAV